MLRKKRETYREKVSGELEILPLMNLFVVLIPMLLLSAVFLEMAVIRMNLPSDEAESPAKETLALSIVIQDARYVIKSRRLEDEVIARSAPEADVALRSALVKVATLFPENHDVVIVSQSHTRYDDIVRVMDISRESGIDNISLSGAN
jgi:biopolymer transport protein ExbD